MGDAVRSGMATTTPPVEPVSPPRPVLSEPEVVIPNAERATITSPIGWSSIFAAAFVAAGAWLVLHLFGIGVGLTAINPDDPSSLRAVGIGTGIWSLLAPIIALFIGGLVAGRVAPTINTLNAAIHGAVVWAVAGLISIVLLTMLVGSVVRGVTRTAGAVAGPVAQLSQGVQALGLDTEDVVKPINERLKARGLPPVTADQLEAVVGDAARASVRGELDRERMVAITAEHTRLDREQAEQLADELEQQFGRAQQRGGEIAEEAGRIALVAAETTGKVLLTLSLTMLLALGAAIGGSILSVRRERREHVVMSRGTTRVA
jgi:hypothetical protein